MTLTRIEIRHFRCITQAELDCDPQRNYIFGPNAAGKTSLLESAYFLGRGRSFRVRQARGLIQEGEKALTVFGQVSGTGRATHQVGVRLDGDGLTTRLDGVDVRGRQIAERLPVFVIDPTVHQLIEGGPDSRRRFLDWGVFHVEHDYLPVWRRYRRALGQRNAALKSGARDQALAPWNEPLIAAAETLTRHRGSYVDRLNHKLGPISQALLGDSLSCQYRPGWPADLSFTQALDRSLERDLERGSTSVGPHRGEMRVLLGDMTVKARASRGQQKLVAAALTLAQVELLESLEGEGSRPLLLVDDPAAELGTAFLDRFLEQLQTTPAQLVVTALDQGALPADPGFPMFHVEQGRVRKMV